MRFRRVIASMPRDFKKLPKAIKWVSFLFGFYYLSWGLLEPFLPIYYKSLFGDYSETSLVLALLHLFAAFWSIPIGRIADNFSRKKLILFFLFFYLPLGPVLAAMKTVFQFAVFTIYHSFLATGLWTAAETYVRAHSPQEQRAESIGLFNTGYNLTLTFAPIAGGIAVGLAGIRPLFYVMPFIIAGSFLAAVFFLPDHDGTVRKKTGQKLGGVFSDIGFKGFFDSLSDFWRDRRLFYLSLVSFVFGLSVLSISSALLPLFSESVGATPFEIGLIFAFSSLPFLFEAPFSVLSDRWSVKKILAYGGILSAAILLGLFFAKNFWLIAVLAFLLGLSFALIIPAIEGLATGLMPSGQTGELNGVYRAIGQISSGVGILAVGPLADRFGINYPFLFASLLMILFSFMSSVWWKKIKPA